VVGIAIHGAPNLEAILRVAPVLFPECRKHTLLVREGVTKTERTG
jgi:hypothetical protein